MNNEPRPPAPQRSSPESEVPEEAPEPRRMFLFEPGWRVGLKVGSERVFCYMMAPGQDYYHRLLDGEIYLHHGDERICLACAQRRGLLSHGPRSLREPMLPLELDPDPDAPGFEVRMAPRDDRAR